MRYTREDKARINDLCRDVAQFDAWQAAQRAQGVYVLQPADDLPDYAITRKAKYTPPLRTRYKRRKRGRK